jgi:para-nitrobenzyl esterase
VPVIIGTTGADIPAWYRDDKRPPYAGFGARERQARDLYEAREFMSRERVASVVSADMNMHEPARFFARQMTAHGARVWLYRFDYVAQSERPQDKHAPHGSELPFLFNQLDARYGRKTTDQDRASARAFHGYIASFVKSGDPNTAGLADWPAFNAARYDLMMFGEDGRARMQTDPLRERIALIESLHD